MCLLNLRCPDIHRVRAQLVGTFQYRLLKSVTVPARGGWQDGAVNYTALTGVTALLVVCVFHRKRGWAQRLPLRSAAYLRHGPALSLGAPAAVKWRGVPLLGKRSSPCERRGVGWLQRATASPSWVGLTGRSVEWD